MLVELLELFNVDPAVHALVVLAEEGADLVLGRPVEHRRGRWQTVLQVLGQQGSLSVQELLLLEFLDVAGRDEVDLKIIVFVKTCK